MLSRLKNIDGYVGRGCVHWDGKYDHRPYKCVIEEVHVHTCYGKNPYSGINKHENVEFVIYNPRLHERFTVKNIELFDNFRECYRCICEYSSFKSLCDIRKYSGNAEQCEKEELLAELANAFTLAKNSPSMNEKARFADYKKNVIELCDGAINHIRKMNFSPDYGYLQRETLYGFIREMMKRYPDMDASRAHRMSEISFEENGK